VRWVITTTVNSLGDGVILNQATVWVNDDEATAETGGKTTDEETKTKWGGVELLKIGAHSNPLEGAKFIVVTRLEADDVTPDLTTAVKALGGVDEDENGVVPAHTVWTSDADGHLSIAGLRYSCFANGAQIPDCDNGDTDSEASGAGSIQYYLVEIEAPAGYSLLAAPVRFLVRDLADTVGYDLKIVNVEDNGGFLLPLTGGMGTTLFFAVGGILLAACLMLIAVSRRRSIVES
jgi:LPXTG-motif cell wall-anchored protein